MLYYNTIAHNLHRETSIGARIRVISEMKNGCLWHRYHLADGVFTVSSNETKFDSPVRPLTKEESDYLIKESKGLIRTTK
jgi:hypothetical protein